MNAKQIADRIVNKSGSYQEVMTYAEGMISPLIERAEAAEARADTYAEMIETLVNEKAKLEAERDEARKQLEQAIQAGRDLQVSLFERKELAPLNHKEEYAILVLNRLQGKS